MQTHVRQSIPQSIAHLQFRAEVDAPPNGVAIDLERGTTHVLGAATDRDVRFTKDDCLCTLNNTLEAASAQPIDSQSRRFHRQIAFQCNMTCQIGSIR